MELEGFGPGLAFWVLSGLTLIAAGGVMVSRNLLHAALFLIVSFLGVSGFFVLLSAQFLAMAQIIIYVGAVAVLILFAILLTPRAGRDNSETVWGAPAALLTVALLTVLLFVIHDAAWPKRGEFTEPTVADLGHALLNTWVLPFQLASVLLTAALIGAIMLVRTPEEEAEDALS